MTNQSMISDRIQGRDGWRWFVVLAVPLILWWLLFDRLRVDWSVNPQYSYGWVVPVLSALLFWNRWQIRPVSERTAPGWMFWVVVVGVCVIWLPISLILEANPEWRLALWFAGLCNCTLCFALIHSFGGWKWVRHFAFPVGFLLIGIPWPTQLEVWIIQGLMQSVTFLAVEALDIFGVAAIQMGNVIEIEAGIVGVEEACSGVRSVQTTLLVALTLGELFGMSVASRLFLLLLGLVVALFGNFARTLFLVWIASRDGLAAVNDWHDTAGIAILVVLLISLGALAVLLNRGRKPPRAINREGHIPPLPRVVVPSFCALIWLATVPMLTTLWYRSHEAPATTDVTWALDLTGPDTIEPVDIGDMARAMLRCDSDLGVQWRAEDGLQWRMYLLEWLPGRNSSLLAASHRPDICLPGIGMELERDLGFRRWRGGGVELVFRHYEFSQFDRTHQVFYCLWNNDPRSSSFEMSDGISISDRLGSVFSGRRNLGQRVIQIAISGMTDSELAWSSVTDELHRRVRRDLDLAASQGEELLH